MKIEFHDASEAELCCEDVSATRLRCGGGGGQDSGDDLQNTRV